MGFKTGASPDIFGSFLASPPKSETLRRLEELIDWAPLRQIMAKAYKPGEGREGFDPVMLFKLLLLQQWHRLSDRDAVWMASDSLSFRSFLGLGASGRAPDDTTLVKFRGRLRTAGLLDDLFAEVAVQMEGRGLGIREGSIRLADATIIPAAARPPKKGTPVEERPDPDADFTVKNNKAHYGYKLHLGQDRETGLVCGHVTTVASVHDSQVFEELLDGGPARALADKAYDSEALRGLCREKNIEPLLMSKARRNKPLLPEQKTCNRQIGRVRSFVEGAPATLKRFMRCGRAVYFSFERVAMQMTLGVLAFNMRRYCALSRESCA